MPMQESFIFITLQQLHGSMRRIALLVPFRGVESLAARQLLRSLMRFSSELGIDVVGNPIQDVRSPYEKSYYDRLSFILLRKLRTLERLAIASRKYDIIIIPYTTSFLQPLNEFDAKIAVKIVKLLIKSLANKSVILYVYDSPVLQRIITGNRVPWYAVEAEKQLFKIADIIITFNKYFKNYLHDMYGISKDNIIEFQILDDYISFIPPQHKKVSKPRKIVWIGNLSNIKNFPANILHQKINFLIYGYGKPTFLFEGNISYKGLILEEERLVQDISSADFGLLYYGSRISSYLMFGTSMKFSTYIVSGLPVITTLDSIYPSAVVKSFNVGWVLPSIDQLGEFIEGLDEEEYNNVRRNVIILSHKIRRGYFFKKALRESLKKIL